MKRCFCILYVLALVLGLVSCGPGGSSFRVKGSFRDMQSGELYIYNANAKYAKLDTLTIQEGRFQYKGEIDEVTPFMLVYPNGVEQVIFIGPGEDLTYEAAANDLRNYVVNGSDENKLMNKFREETFSMNPSSIITSVRSYIKNYPASLVAIYLFDHYLVQNELVGNEEVKEMLKVLKPKHSRNHYLLDIESKIASADKRRVGKTLPDVALTRKDGKTTKLWKTSCDYHLVTFWATWMNNSYSFTGRLREVLNSAEPEKLRVVAISLDIERFRWEDQIRQDSLNSHLEHYCDGLSFESQAVKTLGVGTVPYYILTDKNHKVLDCGEDMNQLGNAISKYVK